VNLRRSFDALHGALVGTCVVAALLGAVLWWPAWQQAGQAMSATHRLEALLRAAEAVDRETAQAVVLLAASDPAHRDDALNQLIGLRQRTDVLLDGIRPRAARQPWSVARQPAEALLQPLPPSAGAALVAWRAHVDAALPAMAAPPGASDAVALQGHDLAAALLRRAEAPLADAAGAAAHAGLALPGAYAAATAWHRSQTSDGLTPPDASAVLRAALLSVRRPGLGSYAPGAGGARWISWRDALLDEAGAQAVARVTRLRHVGLLGLALVVGALLLLTAQAALLRRLVLRPLRDLDVAAQGLHDNDLRELPRYPIVAELAPQVAAVAALQRAHVDLRSLEDERVQLIEQLHDQSSTDFLTGLLNRKAFHGLGERELVMARRHRQDAAVLLVDLDQFAVINDTHGQEKGDETLLAVAMALREATRQTDLLARYAGKVFALLVTQCDAEQIDLLAGRLRDAVADLSIATDIGGAFSISATVGIAMCTGPDMALQDMVSLADGAVRRAKAAGRDRVLFANVAEVPADGRSTSQVPPGGDRRGLARAQPEEV